MSWLVLALNVALCSHHVETVTAQDMYGREVKYPAHYWLCAPGARPADPRAIPLCREGGNPYNPELWSLPWLKSDLVWICGAD